MTERDASSTGLQQVSYPLFTDFVTSTFTVRALTEVFYKDHIADTLNLLYPFVTENRFTSDRIYLSRTAFRSLLTISNDNDTWIDRVACRQEFKERMYRIKRHISFQPVLVKGFLITRVPVFYH